MGKKDKSSKQPKKGKFTSSGLSTGMPDFKYPRNYGIPSGILSMMESMQRIQDMVDPPNLRWIREMQEQMQAMYAPLKPVTDLAAGMQSHYLPLNDHLQSVMSGLQNNALSSIARSMQSITDQFRTPIALKELQGPALLPNIATDFLRRDIWESFPEEDEELEEVAEILEEVQESGKVSGEAVNRLIALTEESVALQRENVEQQKKTNENLSQSAAASQVSLRLQKVQLFLTILMMVLSLQSDQKKSEDTSKTSGISQETATKLDQLFEDLHKEEKETTANLNLRSDPNTKEETKIYLTIPKGETVAIQCSVPRWSYVYYTDPETGILRNGWVSKRYLK
ncbi:SH3 domain-containing protein [Salibacter halophilus]|uniref:SH3 domain-containing protein n=1 Tax=Salibacter halophilus TaxID=1803916 RepID=A0A6N6M401_9FLAO|nr:SH3 domain-containing protein [Salibacter halophilus]KAB1061171.1 SH3 domain-containing protein [Salibacter halophilus]